MRSFETVETKICLQHKVLSGEAARNRARDIISGFVNKALQASKILTVHSPLGFYDFDGASSELDSLEKWLDRVSRETRHPLKKFG